MIDKLRLADKFAAIDEYWSPRIAAELNDSYVKLAKLQGEFLWHHHTEEDELCLVVKGRLLMRLREDGQERELVIEPGELVVIPRGVEHMPVAPQEVEVLLIEPKSTRNTGAVENERTRADQWI